MTLAEARKLLQDEEIDFVLAQFVDIHGAAKAKAVPVEHFDMILNDGAGFAGFALWGFGMGPHGPDLMVVGDPSTLKLLPWMPGYAVIRGAGHVKGQPYPFDTRVLLQNRLAELAERGYRLHTGIEPEFMLLRREADGSVSPFDATDKLDKPCYDYTGLSRSAEFLGCLVRALRDVGIDVYQVDHEDSNGQFEVNFTYSDALTSADNYVFFRMAASEIAQQMDMVASFMPKPFSNRTGTGAHFHLTLSDLQDHSLFQDDSDPNGLGLSELAYHFLGGILAHAPALAALATPTVNSYKRLVVGRSLSGATWAPAYICYGDNNRTSMVRVPYGRLELRLSDGSCNPYLTTVALLAAGLDGIDRKLDPGAPNNTNLYEWSAEALRDAGIGVLPQNLNEALDALEQDEVLCSALGRDLAAEFLQVKRMEWVEYQRHVSQWEVDRYLELF